MIKDIIKKYSQLPVPTKMSLWIFICMMLQNGISFLTVPLFTRMMTTEQYGVYSTFLSWESIFEICVSFRLYAGVYDKGMNKYKDHRDEFALSMQYTVTLFTIVEVFIYLLFQEHINSLTSLSTILTIGLFIELLFCTPMKFWSVKNRYLFNYKPVILATLGFAILNPTVGLIAVKLSEDKGTARIASLIVVHIVYGLFFYIYNGLKAKWKFNISYSKFAICFNAPLIPHYLSEYILHGSDKIMIQKMIGYSQVALYSVAHSIGMLLTILTTSINQALVPWLYQTLDTRDFGKIRTTISMLCLYLIIPIAFFCIISPELVLIFGGHKYSESVFVIPPVCASILSLFWYTICANIEFYYNKNRFTFYISLLGAIVNIALNACFIPKFGYIAAAYTTYISFLIYSVGHFLFMDRIFFLNNQEHLFNYSLYFLSSLITFSIVLFIKILYPYQTIRFVFLAITVIIVLVLRKQIIRTINELSRK